jgi:hypothetical protein
VVVGGGEGEGRGREAVQYRKVVIQVGISCQI